jgi:hypothetical protein
MKRFHIHTHVNNLAESIGFYSQLFAAQPSRVEADYAKWMLDDPRLNFAISTRGDKPGVDHLGFQTDTDEELAELKGRAAAADMALLDEGATTCCYARSNKHWVTDPQGIAWEHFRTLGDIPVFREKQGEAKPGDAVATACCAPAVSTASMASKPSTASATSCGSNAPQAEKASGACCAPTSSRCC